MGYFDRVLATQSASLVAFWPLNESLSDLVAHDLKNSLHGTIGATLGRADGPENAPDAVHWPDLNAQVDLFSAGFVAAFNKARFTLMVWMNGDPSIWVPNTTRTVFTLISDASNSLKLSHGGTPNTLLLFAKFAGTTVSHYIPIPEFCRSHWFPLLIEWDDASNQFLVFMPGESAVSVPLSTTWANALTAFWVGASNSVGIGHWLGSLANVAVWSTLLSTEEIRAIGAISMAEIGKASWTFRDYDGELSNVGVFAPILTAGNFAAQETLRDGLEDAMVAIQIGVLAKREKSNVDPTISASLPTAQQAQREVKWLVSYHDVANVKKFSVEVPCADLENLDPNDRKHANIGDAGLVDAFVTAFEAYVLSPDGHAVVVDEITPVYRNT